jgi:hypothetical protein
MPSRASSANPPTHAVRLSFEVARR